MGLLVKMNWKYFSKISSLSFFIWVFNCVERLVLKYFRWRLLILFFVKLIFFSFFGDDLSRLVFVVVEFCVLFLVSREKFKFRSICVKFWKLMLVYFKLIFCSVLKYRIVFGNLFSGLLFKIRDLKEIEKVGNIE